MCLINASDNKEHLELPLGEDTLVAERSDSGYRFSLRSASGNVCEVFRVSHKTTRIRESRFQSNDIIVNRDYDDPLYAQRYELLDPDCRPTVRMRPDGRLYCEKCHCYVPNTANHEMRKEGCYAHSHVCGVRAEGEIYESSGMKSSS